MTLSRQNKAAGFTLVEILMSSFILMVVVGVALLCFIGILKTNRLVENTSDVSLGLQRATQQVLSTVVSSPTDIQILNAAGGVVDPTASGDNTASGVSIRIAPPKNHYIMVTGGTDTLDAATTTRGYNNTRTTLNFSTTTPQATTRELLQPGATCPSASVSTLDPLVFVTTAPAIDATQLFDPTDVVTIPQTPYGGPRQLTIQSGSTAVTSSTISFTTALNTTSTTWALPNGTLIANTAGPRSRITVITTATGALLRGDLVYYPDDSDLTKYSVLAHNIHSTPRTNPTSSASANESPFIYNTQTRELIVNLQCLPVGNRISGRSTIGTRMRIRIRTTPNSI